MNRVRLVLAIVVFVTVGASNAFSGSATNKSRPKASGSLLDKARIHNCVSCHSLTKEEARTIFKGLGEVKSVKMSPLKGLYEVSVQQGNRQAVAYLDFSKKLLVLGPIFDTTTKTSLTPPPVELPIILSKEELDKIPLKNSIVMGQPNGKKRLIVFTDPDCPFCVRLHEELKKLVALEPDLVIYIKMFPLRMHPDAYNKARVILGSNSLEMLEKAFEKGKLPEPGSTDPKEPVEETLKLGESLGIDGTPAIILPGGRLVAGAKTAAELQKLLVSE